MVFEEIFNVPGNHSLRQLSFRQKGTLAQNEYWEHEEIDSNGIIVARYESWHCTSINPPFKTRSGFRKFSADGKLASEADNLPI